MANETSEEKIAPEHFCWILRNYAASGILDNINGLIMGRPYNNKHAKAYNQMIMKVVNNEEGLTDLPIITGIDFQNTCPTITPPYGIMAEINSHSQTFSILESGVSELD